MKTDRLLDYGLLLFTAAIIVNLMSALFHIYVARVLGPEKYGVLGSLLAILGGFAILFSTMTNVLVKYSAEFWARQEYAKLRYLLSHSLRKFFYIGAFLSVIVVLFSGILSDYLKINSHMPVLVLGVCLFFTVLISTTRPFLSGLQKFNVLGFNLVFESFIRFLFGVILVSVGFGVAGVLSSYLFAVVFAFILTLYPLRFIYKYPKESLPERSRIYEYSLHVSLAMVCIAVLFNLDVVIVRHIFTPYDAGVYTARASLGKLVILLVGSIVDVMFPLVSDAQSTGRNPREILKHAFMYTGVLSAVFIVLPYYMFPRQIISLLFGGRYTPMYYFLGSYSVSMLALLFNIIFIRFYLAIEDFRFLNCLVPATLLFIYVVVFHSRSPHQLLGAILATNLLLLVAFLYISQKRLKEKT